MMLAAALAFAFHVGVVAALELGGAGQAGALVHLHEQGAHEQGAHEHGSDHHAQLDSGEAHVFGEAYASGESQADADAHPGKARCKTTCCGSACTIAVLSTPAVTAALAEASVQLVASFVPILSGTDPNRLKRPPRTPGIA